MPEIGPTVRETIGALLKQMGVRWLVLNEERSVTEMPHSPMVSLPGGGFFGGALMAMADPTANVLCTHGVNPTHDPNGPATVTAQVNIHLMRNSAGGKVRAEARWVHQGRRTMVVETRVTDDAGKLLMLMTSTHLVR